MKKTYRLSILTLVLMLFLLNTSLPIHSQNPSVDQFDQLGKKYAKKYIETGEQRAGKRHNS